MSRVCEVSGKSTMVGNNVSHANNKNKRKFFPNLHNVSFYSDSLQRSIKVKASSNGIRTVDSKGGIDNWLKGARSDNLSNRMKKLKKLIINKE